MVEQRRWSDVLFRRQHIDLSCATYNWQPVTGAPSAEQCNATCGSGSRLRRVECQDHLGRRLPDHRCSWLDRPVETRVCQLPACPASARQPDAEVFSWRVSRWSKVRGKPCEGRRRAYVM